MQEDFEANGCTKRALYLYFTKVPKSAREKRRFRVLSTWLELPVAPHIAGPAVRHRRPHNGY
jgi:hypothetical protein